MKKKQFGIIDKFIQSKINRSNHQSKITQINSKNSIMPKFFFICICLSIVWQCSIAQEVKFSVPQKIPQKISEYEIVGRTGEGIVVHKWGEKIHQIEMFDKNSLDLKWQRELDLGDKRAKILEIIPYPKEMIILFSVKRKRTTYIYARKVTAAMRNISEDVVIDTIVGKFGSYGFKHKIDISQNKEYVNVWRYNYNFNGLDYIENRLINKDLEEIGAQRFEVEDKMVIRETLVSNEGDVFVAKARTKRTLVSNAVQYDNVVLIHARSTIGKLEEINIEKGEYSVNDLKIEMDNRNNQVVVAGFYSDKSSPGVVGFFYVFVDVATKDISQKTFIPFDEQLTNKINRSTLLQAKEYVFNLGIKRTILRRDGGALLIGEAMHTSDYNMPRTSFDTYFNSTSTNYNYEDIVVLSINPDGSLLWGEVLNKRQQSEEDGGYYSSFGIVNVNEYLSFVFNENISSKTNLNHYLVKSDGEYIVSSLLNVMDYNMMVAPRYCKQISRNEAVVPGFNSRNEFILMKLSF